MGQVGRSSAGGIRAFLSVDYRVLAVRISLVCAFAFLSTFGNVSAAQAAVDWVVNVSDVGSDPMAAGGTVNYGVSVSNNGFTDAGATTLQLQIPANSVFDSATGTITGCAPTSSPGPSVVTCNVPALASGATASVTAHVRALSQGAITLSATVPATGDADGSNNTASQLTTITSGANLGLTVSAPATATSGSQVTLQYTVTNFGPDNAVSFTFSFPAPTGLTSFSVPGGCSLAGATYTCTFANSIAVNGTFNFSITALVSAAGGSTVTSSSSLTASSPADPVASNNTATANISITAGTDVALTMSRAPSGSLNVGTSATFTINASYSGDSPNGLVIEDIIPSNFSITSVTPSGGSGWSCTTAGQTVQCSRASGAGAGANVSLGSIAIATQVISSGTVTNTATISAAGPAESFLGNNTASNGATLLDPIVDLRANKSGPNNPALVVVGNSYNYIVSASNVGNAPFFGTLVLTDTLPSQLQVSSYTLNGWSCSPTAPVAGPASIVCQRVYTSGSPLGVGATTPAITFGTLVMGSGAITNAVEVSSPDANIADLNASNNTASYAVTSSDASGAANLRVVKSAALPSLAAGDIQTFTIEIINDGPALATSVVFTDNVTGLINSSAGPTGAGFVSGSVVPNAAGSFSCTSNPTGGTSRNYNCNFTDIPVCTAGSDCPVVTISVRPGGNAGGRSNSASAISSAVADPNLTNNTGSASFTIDGRADVTVSKSATPSPAVAGQNLTYVITAQNIGNGLSSADNVTVIDTLPANLRFVSTVPSAGICSVAPAASSVTGPGNNQVTCNLGSIANGAQRTLQIVVQPLNVLRGTSVGNGVTVSTSTLGDNLGNNTALINTTVQNPVLDILVNNDDTPDPVVVGDNMTYSISVTNAGPSTAENVEIQDSLPASRLSYQSHTITGGGVCTTVPTVGQIGGSLNCSFATLPAGATRLLTITMRAEVKGVTSNTADITSDEIAAGFDSIEPNNHDSEQTTIRSRADLEVVSKIPSVATPNLRDDFVYTIKIRNNVDVGLSDADDVILVDTLPAGMALTGSPSGAVVAGTSSLNSCTGNAGATSFTCNFGTMTNGAEVDITVPVELVSVTSLPHVFNNTASATTSSFDTQPGNNSNSGSVSVGSSAISGKVFRDFGNDGSMAGGDTGVSGLSITLSGTSFDGNPVTQTRTTLADGSYSFPLVPQGDLHHHTRGNRRAASDQWHQLGGHCRRNAFGRAGHHGHFATSQYKRTRL